MAGRKCLPFHLAVLLIAVSAVAQLAVMAVLTPSDIPFVTHFDVSAGPSSYTAGDDSDSPFSKAVVCFFLRSFITVATTCCFSRVDRATDDDEEAAGVAMEAGCCVATRDVPHAGTGGQNY